MVLVDVISYCYSSISATSFTILTCADADGSRMLRHGPTTCYSGPQIAVFCTCIVGIVVYPLVVFALIQRSNRDQKQPLAQQSKLKFALGMALHTLSQPYRDNVNWWEALLLMRRFLTLCFATFVDNPLWRSWLLGCCSVLFLVHHLLVHPYKNTVVNIIDTLLLSFLTTISILEIASGLLELESLPWPEGTARTGRENLISILVYSPFIFSVLMQMVSVQTKVSDTIKFIRGRSGRGLPPVASSYAAVASPISSPGTADKRYEAAAPSAVVLSDAHSGAMPLAMPGLTMAQPGAHIPMREMSSLHASGGDRVPPTAWGSSFPPGPMPQQRPLPAALPPSFQPLGAQGAFSMHGQQRPLSPREFATVQCGMGDTFGPARTVANDSQWTLTLK